VGDRVGAATRACFGLGTVPLLALVGCGGSLLGVAFRRRILLVAAWCVVLTGVLTVGRGVSFLHAGPVNQNSPPARSVRRSADTKIPPRDRRRTGSGKRGLNIYGQPRKPPTLKWGRG